MESLIIGIAGGSGSGKSTFTNRIKKRFGDDVVVLYHDNYYRRQDGIIKQYLNTVKPMHYLYVEPTRSKADIVINSGKNDVAFDLFVSKISMELEKRKQG